MAKYVLFFGYSPESWHRMIDSPGDRTAAARAVIEGAGGTLEAIYWMFGEWDGFAIFEAPGSINAAAGSVAIGSTGAFRRLQTHELLDQAQLTDVLSTAKQAQDAYRPPGE